MLCADVERAKLTVFFLSALRNLPIPEGRLTNEPLSACLYRKLAALSFPTTGSVRSKVPFLICDPHVFLMQLIYGRQSLNLITVLPDAIPEDEKEKYGRLGVKIPSLK